MVTWPSSPASPLRRWPSGRARWLSSPDHQARRDVDHWTRALAGPFVSLPVEHADEPAVEGSARTQWVTLGADTTSALLGPDVRSAGSTTEELLLTGISMALHGWLDGHAVAGDAVLVDVERHGREADVADVDVTHTVGWMTSCFPVSLSLADADPQAALRSTASRLRAVPRRGAGYLAMRELGADDVRRQLARAVEPELSFNYLGVTRRDRSEVLSEVDPPAWAGPPPRARDAMASRTRLLAVEPIVTDDCLRIGWTHDGRTGAQTALQLAQRHAAAVQDLVVACTRGNARVVTADLSRSGLAGDAFARLGLALGREQN